MDSSALGGDREGVGVIVSFGDCLPLMGSWAECAASSEEGETAEMVAAAIGGVRRQRVSSGEDFTESSTKAVHAELRAKGRRRRKKQRDSAVQLMHNAREGEVSLTTPGHSGSLGVDLGREGSCSGSNVREVVLVAPERHQGARGVAEGEGGASVSTLDGAWDNDTDGGAGQTRGGWLFHL